MNKSEKYSEIILLGQMLQERKIEHEQHDLYDGYQIIVPLPEPTKEISVIEHQCSYGSIMNLLEIWADGSIQGYLSAKQTLRIIERVKAGNLPGNKLGNQRKGEKCDAGNQRRIGER